RKGDRVHNSDLIVAPSMHELPGTHYIRRGESLELPRGDPMLREQEGNSSSSSSNGDRHKLSRSYDMQEAQLLDESGNRIMDGHGGHGSMQRRHHSAQRLRDGDLGGPPPRREEDAAVVLPDHQGNLRIIVRKSKPTLGIAIEGGANTKHPLPRIINIHDNGAAYDAGGLEVGQLILEVDGHKVEGLHHQEVARLIAESFARRDRGEIEFLVVEAKKSNLEPKPTALIFLEA
ncbi:unnamed protein product, partial [Trichogramma brassicae]